MVYTVYAALILSLLLCAKKKTKDGQLQFFSKNDTLCWKGFAAVAVVLHHLGQDFSIPDPIAFNGYMGGISVGIFFLLSAYGLSKSIDKKGYYKRIFRVKIPSLYLLQICLNTVYYFLFFTNQDQTFLEVMLRILNVDFLCGLSRLNGFSWFIPSILIVYACFGTLLFVWEKLQTKYKNPHLWFAVASTLLIVFLFMLVRVTPVENLYVRSILCFPLGVWAALYEKEILRFLSDEKRFWWIFAMVSGATVLCFFLLSEHFVCVAVCLLILIFFSKWSYPHAPIHAFFGGISLGIYLLQKIFFLCIPIESEWLHGTIILTLSLAAAFLLHLFLGLIKRTSRWLLKK